MAKPGEVKEDYVSINIKRSNRWEFQNTKRIIDNLARLQKENPDKKVTLIDVGGNIGWFTLAIASKGYHVITFEAFNKNAYAIRYALCI